MSTTKTLLKRATAYALAFVMAFSLLFTGSNTVTANAASAVTKITVKKKSVTLQPKKSTNIAVTVKGGNKKFTVKSSNKKVATAKVVGKKVRITAKNKTGKATVTVTTKGKNKKGKKLKAKIAVTVSKEDAAKKAADQTAATAAVTIINNIPATVDASDATKAAIDAAEKAYNALTDDQKKLVDAATVQKITDAKTAYETAKKVADAAAAGAVTSVAFDKATYEIETGKSVQALVTVLPADATNKEVNWNKIGNLIFLMVYKV